MKMLKISNIFFIIKNINRFNQRIVEILYKVDDLTEYN